MTAEPGQSSGPEAFVLPALSVTARCGYLPKSAVAGSREFEPCWLTGEVSAPAL